MAQATGRRRDMIIGMSSNIGEIVSRFLPNATELVGQRPDGLRWTMNDGRHAINGCQRCGGRVVS
jgi:hypothetical protein